MRSTVCWLLAACIAFSGCRTARYEYPLFDEPDEHDEWLNELWRQGYGFNNPNAERIRNGQEPLNFDGSEDSCDSIVDEFVGHVIGNVFAYTLFEAVPDLLRGAFAKLRHLAPKR